MGQALDQLTAQDILEKLKRLEPQQIAALDMEKTGMEIVV